MFLIGVPETPQPPSIPQLGMPEAGESRRARSSLLAVAAHMSLGT